jgi:hypothetical protein
MVLVFFEPVMVKTTMSCQEKEVPICNRVCGTSRCRNARAKNKCPSGAGSFSHMISCRTFRYRSATGEIRAAASGDVLELVV